MKKRPANNLAPVAGEGNTFVYERRPYIYEEVRAGEPCRPLRHLPWIGH